ncbi:MAG: Gfo/Idh/MocA family oxidoreductase [Acidobacteria bacterium]|nr:Gfo/Idh/MocA family oxidoreductase [Acidobacteriota bacterium]
MFARRTLFLAPALLHAQAKPIGIGFLGTSHSHGPAKVETVLANPAFKLIGVTEGKSAWPSLTREELLRHPEIEVVAVESENKDHARDALAVLEAGKHLHLEKIPAANMVDFVRVVETAKRKRLLLQLGYMWRYHPGINLALEAARKGWLGKVYLVRAAIGNQLDPKRRPEWAAFKGGVMFELGCHVIDPVVRLLGKPSKVTPVLRSDGLKDGLADNTAAILEFDGAMAIVHGSNLQPNSGRYRAFEVHGTNGAIVVNPIEPPAVFVELGKAAGPYAAGKQTVPMPSYKRYVDDFIDLAAAIRTGKKLPATFEEELNVQSAVLAASGM